MEDQQDTRRRLVEVAQELFWRKGYTRTGIADILAAAGVLRGSLYHYFPTKEDLLAATLEWRKTELWPDVIDPVFARVSDPIERVFGVLDGYRRLLEMTDFQLGCPIGNLALELGTDHERVRGLLVENFDGWRDAIRGCLDEASGRLPAEIDRKLLADFVLVTMEGAVMLARTHRSLECYDNAVSTLRDYFERLLADGSDWSVQR